MFRAEIVPTKAEQRRRRTRRTARLKNTATEDGACLRRVSGGSDVSGSPTRFGGPKAIERVRRTQPAAYLKILALLVPREHKVEHRNPVKDMTDEELEAAIEFIQKMLATQAEKAKVIDGTTAVLPAPAEFEQLRP